MPQKMKANWFVCLRLDLRTVLQALFEVVVENGQQFNFWAFCYFYCLPSQVWFLFSCQFEVLENAFLGLLAVYIFNVGLPKPLSL